MHSPRASFPDNNKPRPDRPGPRQPHRGDPSAEIGAAENDLSPSGGWEIADLVAAGVLDVIPGDPPVPVSVWRATGAHEPPARPEDLFSGLTPRLAAMLLAIYTDPGDLVLDATADVAVEGAAGAGARSYRPITLPTTQPQTGDLADLADLADQSGTASLILLRWPPFPASSPSKDQGRAPVRTGPEGGTEPDPEVILAACAGLLRDDGHTVLILAPPSGGLYRDYARAVIPAAQTAGLGYLQHLVVITGSASQPSADTPAGTPDTADCWRDGPGIRRAEAASPSQRRHLDLLVFVLRHGSRP